MDVGTVVARLSDAEGAAPGDLSRVCEDVAAALFNAGTPPSFEVASADFNSDPFLLCADRYWRQRFLEQPSVRTAADCARWIAAHIRADCQAKVREQWAFDNGYLNRGSMETTRELIPAEDITSRGDTSQDIAFMATLYHAAKLRANFACDDLHAFLESSPLAEAAGRRKADAAFVALQCFAAFGSRTLTVEYARELLDRAWSAPDRSRAVTDICLRGLAYSVPFDDQAELLRRHAEEAIAAHPRDHMFRSRLATGLHMCGLHDAALENIDTALALLSVSPTFSRDVLLEQYLVKREAIQEGRLRARKEAEHLRRWEQQDAANAELEHTMHGSSIRAVELVAVFTAAIAFAVGSLQVTLTGTLSLRDRLWLLSAQGVILAVFALLIVGGTWLITRPRSRHRQ